MSDEELSSNQKITISAMFEDIKNRKHKVTDKDLDKIYDSAVALGLKYKKTNQILGLYKLVFILDTIEKEHALVKMGVNTFVYKDDISKYIDLNKKKGEENGVESVVKLIELSKYEREIPDEVADIVEKTKGIFDEFYIVFTDYTQKTTRRAKAVRKEKDPILFGAFIDHERRVCVDRFYFLGDWIDEFCDLTLDKMVATLNENGVDAKKIIYEPKDVEGLRELAAKYKEDHTVHFSYSNVSDKPKKKTLFNRVRTFLGL